MDTHDTNERNIHCCRRKYIGSIFGFLRVYGGNEAHPMVSEENCNFLPFVKTAPES